MITQEIKLNNPERFPAGYKISEGKVQKAIDDAIAKLESNMKKFGENFPGTCTKEHRYVLGENKNWECGMYTGTYWLAYELSGKECFREIAEKHYPTYVKRVKKNIEMHDHDVGFVFSPSCVAQYKLTGDENARQTALEAAMHLYDYSFSKEGGFIIRYAKARDDEWAFRTMMDSMLNAPLLYWAGKETGINCLKEAAVSQYDLTANLLLREDGSSFHHYQFEVGTGKPLYGCTFQGHADDSTWSRGHAWGIYGFPIAYDYTKDEKYIETHKGITKFMLNHLPEDLVPYWDYDFTSGDEARDSSAGAASAAGMLEMARLLPEGDEYKILLESAAAKILEAVIDNCTGNSDSYDGLITKVTHAKPFGEGIDESAVYGDYFYLEALLRYVKPDWNRYW